MGLVFSFGRFIFAESMKRFASAILLLVYFTVSTGFAVSMHYCMNRLESTEMGVSHASTCGKCGMEVEDSDGCCRDEVKIVKLSLDQAFAKQVHQAFALPAVPVAHTEFLLAPLFQTISSSIEVAYPPPLISEADTWLQNSVFRL
jgi:hypothetical protein